MINGHLTAAFIPVRGGSKSIPGKNIKLLNNRPLVFWVLDAALNCSYIDLVYVSTDCEEIRRVVESYGSSKIHLVGRSEETATDTASTESAMIEFANNHDFEKIVLIQATSPLLTSEDLCKGIEIYQERQADSLVSLVRQKKFLWTVDGDIALPENYDPLARPRRQDFRGILTENGAFYITDKQSLLTSGCRISGQVAGYEMPEESYFDIDEETDWVIVEKLLQKRLKKNSDHIEQKIKRIKLVAMDCDGVLTDGGMYYSESGDELKKFNTRDGMGIGLLHKAGIKTAVITGENRELVRARAKKLGIDEVYLGAQDKLAVLQQIKEKYTLLDEEIAYIGDDINDIEVLKVVGLKAAVNDAMEKVKEIADYVTTAKGGNGAVRELCEYILKKR